MTGMLLKRELHLEVQTADVKSFDLCFGWNLSGFDFIKCQNCLWSMGQSCQVLGRDWDECEMREWGHAGETAEGSWSQPEAADAMLEDVSAVPTAAAPSHAHTQTNSSAPSPFYLFGCSCRSHSAPNRTRWVCLAAVGPDRPPCPWYSGPRPRDDRLRLPPPRWSCWCHWRSPSARHAGLVTRKKKSHGVIKDDEDERWSWIMRISPLTFWATASLWMQSLDRLPEDPWPILWPEVPGEESRLAKEPCWSPSFDSSSLMISHPECFGLKWSAGTPLCFYNLLIDWRMSRAHSSRTCLLLHSNATAIIRI